jgi:hypothetical protein
MSKKIYAALLPVLAVVAFAIVPSMASAATSWGTCQEAATTSTNCPAGEKFNEFPEFEHIGIDTRMVGEKFVLENVAKTADIECFSLENIGYDFNIGKVGHSREILVFDSCKGSGLFKECSINSKTNHEIEGDVTNEVVAATEVKITLTTGFNVKCLKGGVEENLGEVTGSVTGKQTEKTNVLKFAKVAGLKFAGEEATINGEVEAFTLQGKKVYI